MNKHGFTLLEVTLFFAVSGLLALVAFAGLGPRLRNVRFTDAVRGLETSVQRQLSDFQAGVNNRTNFNCSPLAGGVSVTPDVSGAPAGEAGDCILNGKYVIFLEDKAIFYPVVSLRRENSPCTHTPEFNNLLCYSPVVVGLPETKSETDYLNGLKLNPATLTPDPQYVYIQSPNGTDARVYRYNKTLSENAVTPLAAADLDSNFNTLCFGLSGRTASLQYSAKSLQPKIDFEGC